MPQTKSAACKVLLQLLNFLFANAWNVLQLDLTVTDQFAYPLNACYMKSISAIHVSDVRREFIEDELIKFCELVSVG